MHKNIALPGNRDTGRQIGAGLPVGKMYHSITYGKNLMGSYASQLTPEQRWEVICYIQQFFDQPE